MTIINVLQISTITIEQKLVNDDYEYKNEWGWWVFKRKAGFYYNGYRNDIFTPIEQIQNCYAEDNKIYFKPFASIRLINNTVVTKYFPDSDSLFEFVKYVKRIKSVKWIS